MDNGSGGHEMRGRGRAPSLWRAYRRLPGAAQGAIAFAVVLIMLAAAGAAAPRTATVASGRPAPVGTAPPPPSTSTAAAASTSPSPTDPPASVLSASHTGVSPPPADVPAPDPTLTPGATFATATPAQICVAGYSASVRNVSAAEKAEVFARYHLVDTPGAYEVDHLISLELGGSNDIANLWPEPYAGRYGARTKDRIENFLHEEVCNRTVALADAQIGIATHWWIYLGAVGVQPPPPAPPGSGAGVAGGTSAGAPPPGASPTTALAGRYRAGEYCSQPGSATTDANGATMTCTADSNGDGRDRWRH